MNNTLFFAKSKKFHIFYICSMILTNFLVNYFDLDCYFYFMKVIIDYKKFAIILKIQYIMVINNFTCTMNYLLIIFYYIFYKFIVWKYH